MKKSSILIWSLVLIFTSSVFSQAPGGVTGAQAWFKTNMLPGGSFNWQDFGGGNSKLNNWGTKNEYLNAARYYNFNPALYFDGNSKQFFLDQTNLTQGTVIGLFGHYATYFNNENILFGITGLPNKGTIITNDKVVNSTERDGEVLDYGSQHGEDLFRKQDNSEGTEAKFRERSLKVVSYYQYQQPNSSVWGEDQQSNLTLGYGYLNYATGLSTYNIKNFSNNFYGFIPELLVYSRVLTPLERRKAETYLAIKYGVSLGNSYISSDDKLLWDWSDNKTYNNRITGIMRDDTSGLNQPSSTTSYEEGPYFSDAMESFAELTYRDQSSQYRLLAMGQLLGCDLADKNATLWGDDDGLLTTQNSGGVAGIKRMSRTWKLVTNTPQPTIAEKTLLFNNNGLETDSGFGKCTFTNKTTATTGTSVTKTPLQGKNGYMEFTTTTMGGLIVVKFGAQNGLPSTLDYGVRIDPDRMIYLIENTKAPIRIGQIAENYHKTTVEKRGNNFFVNIYRIDGFKAIGTITLPILAADVNKPFYGIVSLEKKNIDIPLTVKHGGFAASGSKVELSFDAYRAAEFASNADKSFLVIDRSGTGEFGIENTEYYPVSEVDQSRKKIVFNNVVWDTDGNGKDVFSFGYKSATVKLIALEEGIPPTCVEGILQENGKINIEVKEGLPGYKYTLAKTGTTAVLQTGTFFESKKALNNIAAGTYDLTLEMVGTNFEKTGGATLVSSVSTTAMLSGGNGTMEWAVTDFTSDKYIGFISQKAALTTALLNYGVQIKQNQLFFWNKGVASSTPLATLEKGSVVKLEMQSGILKCTVNSEVVGTQNLATPDVTLLYYGMIALDGESNGIYNLVHTGFVTGTTKLAWSTASYLNITEGDGITNKIIQKIELAAPQCKEILPEPTPLVTDNLTVAPVPSKAGANFNIYVKLNNPSAATVLIFTTSGSLITQLQNSELQKSSTFTTSVPTPGIYIIKVLTTEGEFSKSIIIN